MEGRGSGSAERRRQEVFGKAVTKSPEVVVSVRGHPVTMILDTGSEVTILPETIYRQLSNEKPDLQDISQWLKVYGANGLEIPYVGYTELDISLLGVQLNGAGVLISRTVAGSLPPSTGLLGSNALRELRVLLKETYGRDYLQQAEGRGGKAWANPLFAFELEEAAKPQTGFARVSGGSPVCVPARTIQAVRCFSHHVRSTPTDVIVQAVQGDIGNLPRNLAVVDTLSSNQAGFVDVRVANLGHEDVWLSPKTRIGVVMEAEQYCSGDSLVRVSQDGIFVGFNHMVEAHANAVHTSEGSEDNLPCDVNIGDVDLTPTQHKELASLLRRFQDVFCRDQDDLGFTSTI